MTREIEIERPACEYAERRGAVEVVLEEPVLIDEVRHRRRGVLRTRAVGEDQWFDARAGVGSPGYPPSVEITEVNFGAGWESPDVYPQLNLEACEQELMERLAALEADEYAAQADAEYAAWIDSKRYSKEDWQ